MAILLIIVIALSFISIAFDRVASYELHKYMFKKKKLGLNLGKILRKNQIDSVLKLLLNEDIRYGVEEKRLNIFSCKFQLLPFYLVRKILILVLKNKELEKTIKNVFAEEMCVIAYFCQVDNFIEIYEFNLIRWCNANNINVKEYIIKVIFHEYRHKYQYNLNMRLNEEEAEKDAEEFAENFFIKNKERIEIILAEDNCIVDN